MILYSITFNVDSDVASEWLDYIKLTHLPRLESTGLFDQVMVMKLLSNEYNPGATTFSCQLMLQSLTYLNQYQQLHEEGFDALLLDRFEGKFVFFKTVLKQV